MEGLVAVDELVAYVIYTYMMQLNNSEGSTLTMKKKSESNQ